MKGKKNPPNSIIRCGITIITITKLLLKLLQQSKNQPNCPSHIGGKNSPASERRREREEDAYLLFRENERKMGKRENFSRESESKRQENDKDLMANERIIKIVFLCKF